jgi:pyruvate/2-oxoglutarate dehydrogenase complex dihydrolipoamide dehydrogenase (E3) component
VIVGTAVAAVAQGLGVEVTVLESAAAQIAQAVGEKAGQMLARPRHDHGIQLRTGVSEADYRDQRTSRSRPLLHGVRFTDSACLD